MSIVLDILVLIGYRIRERERDGVGEPQEEHAGGFKHIFQFTFVYHREDEESLLILLPMKTTKTMISRVFPV